LVIIIQNKRIPHLLNHLGDFFCFIFSYVGNNFVGDNTNKE